MNTELLQDLLQRLDEPLARYTHLDRYYDGKQPLAFLAPEAKIALGNRFTTMVSNIPRLAVTAIAERLRITGFLGDPELWTDWIRNDLDQLSGLAHREALLLGDSYVMVWADQLGRPKVTVESAKQVTIVTDPGSRETVAGLKRWETTNTTEAVLYERDQITRLRSNQTGATTGGFYVVEEIVNPLGVVPIVAIRNSDRILDDRGASEITDLMPLVDGLNKVLTDMLVTSEYVGRPRRWATGIELIEETITGASGDTTVAVNPIPEGNRAMISESPDAKFGQLPSADLQGYEAAVRVLLGQVMAVSTLPAHYIGQLTQQPTSADALRAAEASLTARAEARQSTFGRAWEQVGKLMVAVRDGLDPAEVDVRVQWADASTRSVSQEADAVTKLFQVGLLPDTYALQRLGYSEDEIAEIRAARRGSALDTAGMDLGALVSR